MRLEQLAFFR